MEVVQLTDAERDRERAWLDQILNRGPRHDLPIAAGKVCQTCGELGFYEDADERTASHSQCGGDFLGFSVGHDCCAHSPSLHDVRYRAWRYCEACRSRVVASAYYRLGHCWLCADCEVRFAAAEHPPGAVLSDLALRRFAARDRVEARLQAADGSQPDLEELDEALEHPVSPLRGWLPDGLSTCQGCGRVRGVTKRPLGTGEVGDAESVCLCRGLACRRCGRRRMRRPISDYFDAEWGQWWHVPYFAMQAPMCSVCEDEAERGVSEAPSQ